MLRALVQFREFHVFGHQPSFFQLLEPDLAVIDFIDGIRAINKHGQLVEAEPHHAEQVIKLEKHQLRRIRDHPGVHDLDTPER